MSVTAPPSVPAKTTSGVAIGSLPAELGCDRRHIGRRDPQAVAVVDSDDRRPAAAAEALDGAEREASIRTRLSCVNTELALERLDHVLCPGKPARDVGADLDDGLA